MNKKEQLKEKLKKIKQFWEEYDKKHKSNEKTSEVKIEQNNKNQK